MGATLPNVIDAKACVENASVGECFEVGCFADHGTATCKGTSCICNPGSCSYDPGSTFGKCIPIPTTTTNTTTTHKTTVTTTTRTTTAVLKAKTECKAGAIVGFCFGIGC